MFIRLLQGCVGALCISVLGILIYQNVSGETSSITPPVIGGKCIDTGPLPTPPDEWCGCVWGAIYINGEATANVTVTLSFEEESITFVTDDYGWGDPLFAFDGRVLGANYGDELTLSAEYNGQTVTYMYRAFPDAITQEQEVNLVFPSGSGSAPIAQIEQSTANLDQLMLIGTGTDQDEAGEKIVLYEWSTTQDGIIATQSQAKVPLSNLTKVNQTLQLRVLDNEGVWSSAVSASLDLGLLQPTQFTPSLNSDVSLPIDQISIDFSHDIDPSSVTAENWSVRGDYSGQITGSYQGSGQTATFSFSQTPLVGETIHFTIDGITKLDGSPLARPIVGQFRIKGNGGTGFFTDADYYLSEVNQASETAIGDFNSDGHPDAVITGRAGNGAQVYLNNGSGILSATSQFFSDSPKGVAIADLNGDTHQDIIFTFDGIGGAPNRVLFNNGSGIFTDSGQELGLSNSFDIALGDIDGDHDVDAIIANFNTGANTVWINDGMGNFSQQPTILGIGDAVAAKLADLDQDGDLDAIIGIWNALPSAIYTNDGQGNFTLHQEIAGGDRTDTQEIAIGDVDNDNDLDLFFVNQRGRANQLWLNDGFGNFTDSGQRMGSYDSEGVVLADFDSDGDLDAYIANENDTTDSPNTVWLNDGYGNFTDTLQRLGTRSAFTAAGPVDFDGDGDLDVLVAGNTAGQAVIWFNTDPEPNLEASVRSSLDQALVGQEIKFTVTVTNTGNLAAEQVVISNTLPSGATYVSGGTLSGDQISWEIAELGSGSVVEVSFIVTASDDITNSDYGASALGGFTAAASNSQTVIVADAPPTTWLALLYLSGDNDLSGAMQAAVARLDQENFGGDTRIVALIDGSGDGDSKLYEFYQGTTREWVPAQSWYSAELDMGDPETFLGFYEWATFNFDAQYTYLSIANHGAGVRGLSWDLQNGRSYFSVSDLERIANEMETPVDVLHFDACLMGMGELAYLFRDKASYLIASQNLAWGIFAYDRYFQSIGTSAPADFANRVANIYANNLPNYPYTISVLDLKQIDVWQNSLANLLDRLTDTDEPAGYASEIEQVLQDVQRFDSQDYYEITTSDEFIDVYDFARLVALHVDSAEVDAAAQQLMTLSTVGDPDSVVKRQYNQSGQYGAFSWDLDQAHGISIYYPETAASESYAHYLNDNYQFAAKSGWLDFLQTYVGTASPLLSPVPLEPAPTLLEEEETDYTVYLPVVIRP